jgi:Uma2 family endonuclease
MVSMPTKTLITLEEYEALPEMENGFEYELSNEELIMLASPTLFHNRMRDEILFRFRTFLRQHPQLDEVTSETDFYLTPTRVRRPDVAFITAPKLVSVDPRKKLEFAPDLVVEIASPNDGLQRKIQDYLAGTRIWALYPDARIARIYKPNEPAAVVVAEAGGILEHAELLPGLKIPLTGIFG